MIPILIGLAAGVSLPVQTAVNSRLRHRLGGALLLASFISFAVGTAFLALLTITTGAHLTIPGAAVAGAPWWVWSGGVLGVAFLTGNLLLFPHLGAVETVIMPVLGQLAMSVTIDTAGWFGSPHHPLGPVRIAGAVLVLLGAVLVVGLPSRRADDDAGRRARMGWRLAGVFSGSLSAIQTAVNGRLGVLLGSAIHAAFISFAVGAILLALLVVVTRQWPKPTDQRPEPGRWWMWLGGLLGALVVAGNAYLVPHVGTGLTVMIVLLGQMAGSVFIDSVGLLGTPRRRLSLARVGGLVLMVAGVLVIRVL